MNVEIVTESEKFLFCDYIKGTVQWELRWVKIGINRSILMYSFAGKCPLPCPNGIGHDHESSIKVVSVCSTF